MPADHTPPSMDMSDGPSETRFSVVIEGRHLDITEAVEEAARAQTADLLAVIETLTAENREALLDFRRQTKRAEAAEAKAIDWRDRATAAEAEVNDLRTKYEILDGGYRALVSRCKKEVARAEKAEAERDAAMAGAVRVKPGVAERAVWSAMIWAAENSDGWRDAIEYTDGGNSFAEDEARATVRRILAALEPNPAAQDREALVAATLERARKVIASRRAFLNSQLEALDIAREDAVFAICEEIIADLATPAQTDALAAVRREARAPLIGALRGCIDTAEMVAADLQSRRNCAGIDMNAASLLANNSEALPILSAAEKEAGHD